MGPHDAQDTMTCFLNGEPIELSRPGELATLEFTVAAKDGREYDAIITEPTYTASFTMNVQIPKTMRCHTKRRFTKLMMGLGYSRNDAVRISSAITTAHRFRVPKQYAPTYQGLFLHHFFTSLLQAERRNDP